MQRRSVLALIPMAVAVLALAACALPAFNKQADAEAKELFAQIADGRDLSDNTNLSGDLQNGDDREALGAIKNILPNSAPTKTANSGWSFNSSNGATRAVLSHTYTYADGTVILTQAVMQKGGGADHWTIIGFWATRQSDGTKRGAGTAPVDSASDGDSNNSANASRRNDSDSNRDNSSDDRDRGADDSRSGERDSGDRDSGDRDSGDRDSGDRDSGDRDSGDRGSSGGPSDHGNTPSSEGGDRY